MHFAFCLFKYFPFGGLQRDFIKIARAALTRHHQVTVFTMAWEGPKEPGLVIELIPKRGFSNHQRAKCFSIEVQRRLANKHFDAVLGFNRQAGLDFYFAADPCLALSLQKKPRWWHRFQPRYRGYLKLEAAVYSPLALTHVLLLDPAQQAMIQMIYHTEVSRFTVIPPGIEQPCPMPQAVARASLGLTSLLNTRVLLAIGYDQARKGLDRSLQALAALPMALRQSVQLWVVGSVGIDAGARLAQNLGIASQVHFLGNRTDVYTLMQAADLLLHPAYQETAGMVLVEALANGLPVLVTANCGYAFHIAKAKAGRVIPGGLEFSQATYNTALEESILSITTNDWRACALAYAQTHDLFTMPTQVIQQLERFVLKETNIPIAP